MMSFEPGLLQPDSPLQSQHNEDASLLDVEDLSIDFTAGGKSTRVVHNVSFSIKPGETLGVVGESGSGKSVTALSLARLLPPTASVTSGRIGFKGKSIMDVSEAQIRQIRGQEIGFIFQDPMTSLDPTQTIGSQVAETARLHLGMSRKQSLAHAAELLERVGIPRPKDRLRDYPHQFSGGMRQRVVIAMAISCQPALLIADESTTALDVTTQAQILDLIRKLSAEDRTAVLFITHDLAVASSICDRINVMYSGQIVESADSDRLFDRPEMPYTKALMQCIASLDDDPDTPFKPISGMPPDAGEVVPGCRFQARCEFSREQCSTPPELLLRESGHLARCWGTQKDGWLEW